MNRKIYLLVGITALMTGCSLAPKYNRPEAPIPNAWPSGPAYKDTQARADSPKAAEIPWREFFVDERLQTLIETALNNNRDMRIAALNVERARAYYRVQRAELLPTVNATGIGIKERMLYDSGGTTITEQYRVDLGVSSWEIDFFGRIRSLKQQAMEEYLATEEARRAAQILLVSEVANTYLALAADQENLNLARSTLENQQSSYQLIKRRYEVGLSSELELRQAQTRVDAARVDVAGYTQMTAQDKNALNLLVGLPVSNGLLPEVLGDIKTPEYVSPGAPSEVLLSRPDICQAENLLKAANANIGAARAALFPSISLTTAIGTASSQLSGLFEAGTRTWSFSPQIEAPIFDSRTWAALSVIKVQREIAIAQYEKTIQSAFREVSDALAQRGTIGDQMDAQQSLVNAAADAYRLSNERYTKGIDMYLNVLDAQRSLYGAQQGLIAFRLARLTNMVTLYKVLGGGG